MFVTARSVLLSSALTPSQTIDVQQGLALLRSFGLQVLKAPLEAERSDLSDEKRLQHAQAIPQSYRQLEHIDIAARGGWGSARVLPRLLALDNSSAFMGFSDATSVLWARAGRRKGLAIHGPMLTTLAKEPEWSLLRVQDFLQGKSLPSLAGQGLVGGVARGTLWAGNLCVATHLLGTPYLPELSGGVLVFEEVNEPLYKIDRMLTHWQLSGQLQRICGIGFGRMFGGNDDSQPQQEKDALKQLLLEKTGDLGIPVLWGLPVGHGEGVGNALLPLQAQVEIDADQGELRLL